MCGLQGESGAFTHFCCALIPSGTGTPARVTDSLRVNRVVAHAVRVVVVETVYVVAVHVLVTV